MNEAEIKQFIDEKATQLISHDDWRVRVCNIIDERVDSVPFMEKVQKYADAQIDKRTLQSIKFWLILIASTIVTTLITVGSTAFVFTK